MSGEGVSEAMPPERRRGRRDLVIGCDPFRRREPRLVVALARAGALGVLDLAGGAGDAGALALVARRSRGAPFAVRVPTLATVSARGGLGLPDQVGTVVVPATGLDPVGRPDPPGRRLLVEVTSLDEARRACAAGADGLIASGAEAGGRVGDTEAFVLLQQLVPCGVPVWVRGGLGPHTAAGAVAAGARGIVLDGQLALVRECPLDGPTRAALAAMDGSETRVVGGHRVYTRPDLPSARLPADTPAAEVAGRLGTDIRRDLVPVGQEVALAAALAERHVTAGGVVTAVRRAVRDHIDAARAHQPLAPGHGVARSHGTRYPVAQGPMTRVSDRAAFARAVADNGGLPFLALALLRGPEVRRLLEETAELLGERPWGVGVLGFVPPELRDEQLREVAAVRPAVALVAGGRPAHAVPLEHEGVRTYLHAPSPGLIDVFLRSGARRFVLEGRECGGHVGPRSSFALWEAAVERLLAADDADRLDVLFAGGVHDERSAAAVAALAAPLAERGAHVGVLMGTAYLFTREAVACGAITSAFQDEALACERTVLLETAPGHATRCADTPYVAAFAGARARLEAGGTPPRDMWGELESLNLGRLRIASKGLVRAGDHLREADDGEQRTEGMFMLGQVATLRDEPTTVEALHAAVTAGATVHLAGDATSERAAAGAVSVRETPRRLDVAIVGMAALLPGARDVEQFWANVVAGADAVTEVPASRWDAARYHDPAATGSGAGAGRLTPSKWGGFLPAVGFDALAYGIPPASLAAVDTVQLLALDVAARALADAGYATRPFDRARASVVFGAEGGTDLSAAYGLRAALPSYLPRAEGDARGRLPGPLEAHLPQLTEDSFPGVLTNVVAGRIANRLDLGGVNCTVDAACASSLAALDVACKELAVGGSDMVLCGGADLHNGIYDFLLFASVHALSPHGRCRPFDAAADGIALGEGVACVALKRLADAERDGDRIYAVVEAVRGSSDGRALGLTAPRADGQRRALERAYAQSGRSPASLGLVEAHGTGTIVGDGTELATLTELFTRHGASPQSCVLGSVKSQIGHTKCAAGLAGVVKAARALYHGVLPPTVGLAEPNPHYDEDKSPFRFHDRALPWIAAERRAGVSAFGFGGANVHAVLASYTGDDEPRHGLVRWPAELFLVRGRDADAGRAAAEALADLVGRIGAADPDGERHALRDLARTVCEQGDGPVQLAVVADDLDHLGRQLAAALGGAGAAADQLPAGVLCRAPGTGDPGPVAFLFPGQGSQRVGMLADLFVAFPRLRRHLRAGEAWAGRMLPPQAFSPAARAEQMAALADTRIAQPALGVAELALVDLLAEVGVRPSATAGHSYGELVALAVAGAVDLGDLLPLSEARGTALHGAAAADDPGAMAAVPAPADELAGALARHPGLVVANHNAPRQTVVAGPAAAVESLVAELADAGVAARRLPVACAFHSPLVAAARAPLAAQLDRVALRAPALPVWSNVTGDRYPEDPAEVRRLLADQLARPVRFVEQVEAMHAAGVHTFVEAGPGRVLTGLVDAILGDRPHAAVACDVAGDHGLRRFLLALAELAVHGVDVDPAPLFAERARRLDLGAVPRPRPGWIVDGPLVRTADGEPLPGGLRPATENPVLTAGEAAAERTGPAGAAAGGPAGAGAGEVVTEYLRALRETVAAEREVLLRYLGAVPVTEISVSPSEPLAALPAATGPAAAAASGPEPDGPAGLPPTPEVPADVPADPEAMLAVLTAIVAERTGYPPDMLGADLDLEADLSIDSIKRVEIVGEVVPRLGLPGGTAGTVDDAVVEELARIKTLRGIVEWLGGPTAPAPAASTAVRADPVPLAPVAVGPAPASAASGAAVPAGESAVPAGEPAPLVPVMVEPAVPASASAVPAVESVPLVPVVVEPARPAAPGLPERAVRYVVDVVDAPPADRSAASALAGARLVVIDDGSVVAPAVARRLALAGASAQLVSAGALAPPAGPSREVSAALARADGVVHVALVHGLDARTAFAALAPGALGRARWLAAVVPVRAGPAGEVVPAPGGEAGLLRALAHEVPDRTVRAIGVEPSAGPDAVAAAVVEELAQPGPLDVVRLGGCRLTRRLAPTERVAPADLPLDPGAVVLLTGGARGITARVALAFARAGAAGVELVGRTPLPQGEEPPDLAAARDLVTLRTAVLARGEARTPAEVEAACRRILAAREVRATFRAVARAGAGVGYHQVDVRDADALRAAVAATRRRYGRLDGVVHGAGIIEDRLLPDKRPESFARVFDVKVRGARTLLEAVGDDVGFVVLFGSVSGVLGNRGQVDYAAANDALDALAAAGGPDGRLAGRVLSIDWGPWAGAGMVSDALAGAYERRGMGLLDPDDAVAALFEELATARRHGGRFPAAQVLVARAHLDLLASRGPLADPATVVPA